MSIDEKVDAEIAKISTLNEARIKEIQINFETKLDAELSNVKSKSITYSLGAISVIIAAVAVFLWSTSDRIQSATKDVNLSVISLQKDILSAQTVIQKTQDDLHNAKAAGEESITASRKELDAANSSAARADADFQAAEKKLVTMQKDYEDSLAQIRAKLVSLQDLQSGPATSHPTTVP